MLTDFTQKYSKNFECKICDFICFNKNDFKRHNLTRKHTNLTNSNTNLLQITPDHNCSNCNKKYKSRVGLWNHKKKCFINNETKNEEKNIDITDKNLILTLIQQNNELQKQMLEIIKNGTNNTNINNSNNKTFNLQVFLNETCKDAMNIMDFVDSIKIQLADIESIGELGFVNGISKLIINNLKALDENMRPVHCSDQKRESLYVKDANVWNKEDSDNKKMKKAIKYVAHKNICALSLWKDKYPEYNNSESKRSDQYNSITMEAMGGAGNNDEEKADKIVKKIAKSVLINKNT